MGDTAAFIYKSPEDYGQFIRLHFAKQDIPEMSTAFGELTLTVLRSVLLRLLQFLRDEPACKFSQMTDITCIDYPERPERFTVVYHLLSTVHNRRIRIRLTTDGELPVASASALFPSAVWYEREIWDMFGVVFGNHPDLRRLLTDDDFRGTPLCRDFPVRGKGAVCYDDARQVCLYREKAETPPNRSRTVNLGGGEES
ncbi:MAG: NADH-quinone oxidoreductase subunit C [Alphaproteobacteria bacterium]|jgi:NADH-quinone oxidoreductase subunit C